jgi:hypothetical protein
MVMNRDTPSNDAPMAAIDPYALVEALIGHKLERRSAVSDLQTDYDDDLVNVEHSPVLSKDSPKPDDPPKNVNIGCINPYALVEALIGRKIDKYSISSARILSDVLQTDYDELFDMKHHSLLYAGLALNEKDRVAEKLSEKDVKILNERDLETPDLSQAKEVGDIEKLGLKDLLQAKLKAARMQNGKLHLVMQARDLGKTVTNSEVTWSLNELTLPFRKQKEQWTPPNSSWRDMSESFSQCMARHLALQMERFQIGQRFSLGRGYQVGLDSQGVSPVNQFDDPIQGALGNSWLISAIFSVFWSDPSAINRGTRSLERSWPGKDRDEKKRVLAIKFYDKGGENNAPTATVEVNYEIPINNSNNEPVYCRASDGCDIWPSLYEKAFAKWMTKSSSDHPDITQLYSGDPIKAMAQITDREPQYYLTDRHSASELVGLVRFCSVNFKTINPMCVYTHASGNRYRGSNLVANHAYSVLGWTSTGQHQHIIIRNPWGVTEPTGLTSYPGILDRVEPEFWRPASLVDFGGVLAVEASVFKEYFACIGIAK